MWFVTNRVFTSSPERKNLSFGDTNVRVLFLEPAFGAPPRRLLESRDEKHDTTQKSVNNVQRLSSYVNNAARGL